MRAGLVLKAPGAPTTGRCIARLSPSTMASVRELAQVTLVRSSRHELRLSHDCDQLAVQIERRSIAQLPYSAARTASAAAHRSTTTPLASVIVVRVGALKDSPSFATVIVRRTTSEPVDSPFTSNVSTVAVALNWYRPLRSQMPSPGVRGVAEGPDSVDVPPK